jgi:acyl transferase domain-containing protein/acyl carrier protein
MKDAFFELDTLKIKNTSGKYAGLIKEVSNKEIAIIGVSAKLPMADNTRQYWENICLGIDCVQEFPQNRRTDAERFLKFKGIDVETISYLKGSFLDEIDKFDYLFFKMTPKEAGLMNPLQRIFLETVWHAIEDAGYGGDKITGSNTGVFVGHISDLEGYKYKEMISDVSPHLLPIAASGNLSSVIPGRISYLLNLKGPSLLIDGACSSSLVAVHMACQSIRNKECEMTIAGGIKTNIMPLNKEDHKIGIESSDYFTRTFDETADGSGIGEGAVVFILKSLEQAKRDGDNIYAVIKGSAVNQDGTSIGLTAPNPLSHTDVITKAWESANINPETISYIEAHGTATKLGDNIEIQGIKNAFKQYTNKKQFCAISAVKSNIGHLYDCAGAVGLLKAVLALKNKQIPPSIHFHRPNHKISFEQSPVYINTKLREWKVEGGPRRCGVSSFGINGSNCHLILEESPTNESGEIAADTASNIFTVSAKSKQALYEYIKQYQVYVKESQHTYDQICYTANTGRWHYHCRLAFVVKNQQDFENKLNQISGSDFEKNTKSWIYYGEHKLVSNGADVTTAEGETMNEITEDGKKELNDQIQAIISNMVTQKQPTKWMLHELCQLYIAGGDIEWERIYQGKLLKRISLPGYPFERKRCWYSEDEETEELKSPLSTENDYMLDWHLEELVPDRNDGTEDGIIFMVADQNRMGEELANELRKKGRKVVLVEYAEVFAQIEPERYYIKNSQEDFKKIFMTVDRKQITQIVHLLSLRNNGEITDLNSLKQSQQSGVYSLFYLIKEVAKEELERAVDVVLISSYVNQITGAEERINPENAPLFGLGRAITKEYSFLKCRCIDIDEHMSVKDIGKELMAMSKTALVAYRNKQRYVEYLKEIDSVRKPVSEIALKAEGAYIITGGTGGIGLEIAKYLSSKGKINLVLLSRFGLSVQGGNAKRQNQQTKALAEIEANGTAVYSYPVDIADAQSLEQILHEIRHRFGEINGIIHSAGISEYQSLAKKKKAEFDGVLSAKVYGTWLLDKLTEADNLDFFVLFSSVATIFCAAGQGDYVAANAYMDSFVHFRNKKRQGTQVINWTTWKEVGMSVDQGINVDMIFKALPTSQALQRFESVFLCRIPRVLIGEINFGEAGVFLLEKETLRLSPQIISQLEHYKKKFNKKRKAVVGKDKKIQLTGRVQADYTLIEIRIAEICREIMGFADINIYDSFFEMGADSIMLKKIHAKLESLFPGKVKVADIFEYSNIYKLAQYIVDQKEEVAKPAEKKNIKDKVQGLFEQIGNGELTLEEAIYNLDEI